ncbi:MAG: MFS transporter [Pseudomonadales bacterium]|nr:MFS transporter [Pseudomonadales bacterium]
MLRSALPFRTSVKATGTRLLATPTLSDGLKLLRSRDFSRLFISYLITFTGNAMAPIAIAFGVLELTGSAKDAAMVIAAPTAAQILVLLFGGVIADRTSRQSVIVISDTVAACSQLLIAALLISGNATLMWLTSLMLINGIAMALHSPAVTGLITQVVDRNDLQSANALLGTARNGAMILGAALAGALVAFTSPGITIALDGMSFAASALMIASLKPAAQSRLQAASLIADLLAGWQEFVRHRWLCAIVMQFSLVVASVEAVFALIGPAIARDQLGGPVAWGLITSALGIGTLAGGLASLRLQTTRPMLTATMMVFTFVLLPLALLLSLPVPVMMAFALVQGLGVQIFSVLWYTTLQNRVPGEMLSRVSAYDHLGSIALAPLGIIAGGYLYETVGAEATLITAMVIIIMPTIAVLFVPEVRNLRSA